MTKYTRRRIAVQAAVVLVLVALAACVIVNVRANLKASGMALDLGFLSSPASFEIGQSMMHFEAGQSLARAYVVGLANTLGVSALAILFATLLGTLIGFARLAPNKLIVGVCKAYLETVRNVPLLLQLLFWYSLLVRGLPAPRDGLRIFDCVILTNRGLFIPSLEGGSLVCPALEGFNIQGGSVLTPEFVALLTALSLYGASYISEIVRGSVMAVPKGQFEAAQALGLRYWAMLRHVVLPQALRSMVPPMTSQYLNIVKTSSLAVAIGFPELVRVSSVATSQTGHAIECAVIMASCYLTLSLAISAFMNFYNRRVLARGAR